MKKIVFLGDSVTKATDYGGVGVTDAFPYKVGMACGYLPSEIVNAGVSSNTSAMMLARIELDVIAHDPGVCVVMAMPNDVATGVTVQQYRVNMGEILSKLIANGISPVVASPPVARGDSANFLKYKPYLEAAEAVADENGAAFIDCYREYTFMYLCGQADFIACYVDHIHQTKAGHSKLASIMTSEKWAKQLAPVRPESDPERSVRDLSIGIASYIVSGQSPESIEEISRLRDEVLNRWP